MLESCKPQGERASRPFRLSLAATPVPHTGGTPNAPWKIPAIATFKDAPAWGSGPIGVAPGTPAPRFENLHRAIAYIAKDLLNTARG